MSSYIKQKGSDKASYQDVIEAVEGAATVTGQFVDAGICANWLAHVGSALVGTSLNFKIQQATDASGTAKKDISGKAITALVAAGSALINVSPDELDTDNGFSHIGMILVTAGATTIASAELIGLDARYEVLAQGAEIDEVIG